MRKHICSFDGESVDLDNPETYDYLPKNTLDLDNLMFREIGKAICYMDYFHPDLYPKRKTMKVIDSGLLSSCLKQRQRVNNLIENFTKERKNHYTDTLWYQEQIFLFQDETENMC